MNLDAFVHGIHALYQNIKTLSAYFQNNGDINETAEQLFYSFQHVKKEFKED